MIQRFPRRASQLLACLLMAVAAGGPATAQQWLNPDDDSRANRSMFRQIEDWPDPNDYRSAAGAPGPRYWQQRADYVISTRLDTVNHRVSGSERITYHNNSPDDLPYLWIQLDQNVRSIEHSRTYKMSEALPEAMSPMARRFLAFRYDPFDGGYDITRVQVEDAEGGLIDAEYTIRGTVMKVKLSDPVRSGGTTAVEIDWSFAVSLMIVPSELDQVMADGPVPPSFRQMPWPMTNRS
ncbi:MAG: hypothetical protein R3178_05765, partial [Rhodothermales bacterium]|nr:hypothetical protein [Rhodothermales bacterium]